MLIARGDCSFADKVNRAQEAGASGAIIYNNNPDEGLITMGLDGATLPAIFIGNSAGLEIQSRLKQQTGVSVTMDFSASTPLAYSSDAIPSFTSAGPSPDATLKPDLIGTGAYMITAAPFAWVVRNGTSFSSPLVAGAVAG